MNILINECNSLFIDCILLFGFAYIIIEIYKSRQSIENFDNNNKCINEIKKRYGFEKDNDAIKFGEALKDMDDNKHYCDSTLNDNRPKNLKHYCPSYCT